MAQLHLDGGERAIPDELNDRLFSHPTIGESEIRRVTEALEAGDVSFARPDGETRTLESRLGEYTGADQVLCTNNGTAALYSAFFALGEGDRPERALAGTEVLVPTYEMWSAVAPVLAFGGTPVYCEVDEETLTLDLEDAARKVTDDTGIALLCQMWSETTDPGRVRDFAEDHDLAVVEDASHAWGCRYEGDHAGNIFDVGALSMQAGKSLPAGEGGVVLTDDEEYYERAEALGHYGRIDGSSRFADYDRTGLGYKFRMSPLSAAIANAKIGGLDEQVDREAELMDAFRDALADVPHVDPVGADVDGYEQRGHFGTAVRVDFDAFPVEKADVVEALQAEGLPIHAESEAGFTLLHLEERFRDGEYWGAGELPRSEAVYDDLLRISAFRRGTAADVRRYADAFEKVLTHYAD